MVKIIVSTFVSVLAALLVWVTMLLIGEAAKCVNGVAIIPAIVGIGIFFGMFLGIEMGKSMERNRD